MLKTTAFPEAPIEILKRAREYVAKGFCRGDWAQDRHGRAVMPDSQEAVCWCIEGAMEAAARQSDLPREGWNKAIVALLRAKGHEDKWDWYAISITDLNDRMSKRAVLQWIDDAVGVLKETENECEKN